MTNEQYAREAMADAHVYDEFTPQELMEVLFDSAECLYDVRPDKDSVAVLLLETPNAVILYSPIMDATYLAEALELKHEHDMKRKELH